MIVLVIRDGWGFRSESLGNAVAAACTPVHDRLKSQSPWVLLRADGAAVGLPAGQCGNSEVGHLTLGAGRILQQPLSRIDSALREDQWESNEVLRRACQRAQSRQRPIHLLGLLSDGGVHSVLRHIQGLFDFVQRHHRGPIYAHLFSDGRDSARQQVLENLARLRLGRVRTASLCGRAFAMDRDSRWDRSARALDLISLGRGEQVHHLETRISLAYRAGLSDEDLPPLRLLSGEEGLIGPDDGVIAWNFRGDRMRQLMAGLAGRAPAGLGSWPTIGELTSLTDYDPRLPIRVAFPSPVVDDHLGAIMARQGARQWRCAETEKYAHVTWFFNAGLEPPLAGEDRLLIESRKLASHDLAPEMRAAEIAAATAERITRGDDQLIVVNLANPDMVGHTGQFMASLRAVEAVDSAVGTIEAAARARGRICLLTADHGNVEEMLEADGRTAKPSHSLSPVELILAGARPQGLGLRSGGGLSDVAPTILDLLSWPQPAAMTGRSLLQKSDRS